mgnify:CR=1 FL=1
MAQKKKGGKMVGKIVKTAVSGVLCIALAGGIVAANVLIPPNASSVQSILGLKSGGIDNSKAKTEGINMEYSKPGFDTEEALVQDEIALNKQIAAEGIVLLKNDEGRMPYSTDTTFSFVSHSAVSYIGGNKVDMKTAFEDAGFGVNEDLWKFYSEGNGKDYGLGVGSVSYGDDEDFSINECPLSVMQAEPGLTDSMQGTVPVFVFSRVAGEGRDMPRSMYNHTDVEEDKTKTYLEPDSVELEILQYLNDNFDDVVLLLNSSAAVDLSWVEDYPSIHTVISAPAMGDYGLCSLAEIFSGKVNPSGRTVDTYEVDAMNSPAAQNFGDFAYYDENGNLTKYNYVSYKEGIYVGYRYYETRYEDKVLGQGNAGDYNYDDAVMYPFGYGLSYTTFKQEMGKVSYKNGKISFDVTVTNTGDKAGKDVVEVYYNPPYTDGGIEKASKNLVAFEKTKKLEPGASQTVKIEFDDDDMASYDQKDAKAYVLEQGDYDISIQSDSHHVIDHQKVTVKDTVTYNSDSNTHNGDAVAATNEFDYAAGDVTYLSRAGHFANYAKATAAPTNFSMSDEAKAEFTNNSNYDPKKYDNDSDEMPTTGAKNGLKLYQMYGKDYDDADWDKLLDQLTFDDMDDLIANGGYGTPAVKSVGKIQLTDADGPASLNNNFTGVGSIGFPASTAFACTWNRDLAKQFGEMIGDMAHDMHVAGWYAPAMNIHRSAFSGRTFEYFSEDSLLSGAMASNEIAGAKSKGVYSFMKHFALNDQETNRTNMVCTWANEQSIRETYLKPFEMSVKEGGAQAVMSSFNYIGNTYAGADSALLQTVLRGEWGFKGFVLTDYFGGYGYQNADQEVRAGNDSMLATTKITNHITDKSATSVKAMRQAAHNILYTAANSWQYANGEPKVATPIWKTAMYVAWGVTAVLVIGLEIVAIKRYLNRKKAVATVESAAEPVAAGPANAE